MFVTYMYSVKAYLVVWRTYSVKPRVATALRISIIIIITPARFCAVSSVPSSFLFDFCPLRFVDVEHVVADDRIASPPSGVRTTSCSSRAHSSPAILLTLRDSIAHNAHIENHKNQMDFTETKRLMVKRIPS